MVWMEFAAARITDHSDTHPSLSDRLNALGQSVDSYRKGPFPLAASRSAAAALLGDNWLAIRTDIEGLWQQETAEGWRIRHRRAASLQDHLSNIPAGDPADAELHWQKARATIELEGPEAAEPMLRHVLRLRPNHGGANYCLGQYLLSCGQSNGEIYLQRILDTDDDAYIPLACQVLAQHYLSVGRKDRVAEIHRRIGDFQAATAAAQQERNIVRASDQFADHQLSHNELAVLVEILRQESDLHAAYLARKVLKHFPRQKLFVLCVHAPRGFLGRFDERRDTALAARLIPRVNLPGRVLVITPHGGVRALCRRIMRPPGAKVV